MTLTRQPEDWDQHKKDYNAYLDHLEWMEYIERMILERERKDDGKRK